MGVNWSGADPVDPDRKLDERVGMVQTIVGPELPEYFEASLPQPAVRSNWDTADQPTVPPDPPQCYGISTNEFALVSSVAAAR